jgi:DNA helicase HerA-like ATPase
MAKNDTTSWLTLGWKLNSAGDPEYWLNRDAKLGRHSATDLLQVDAKRLKKHVAIIAQSGSGKSFFLGRLIEEILTSTRAKVLVLDPNGDYGSIDKINDNPEIWEKPSYDALKKRGKFTHESNRAEFENKWVKIKTRIAKRGVAITSKGTGNETPLQLPWSEVSPDVLSIDIDPLLRHEVANCHRIFQSLSVLYLSSEDTDILKKTEQIISEYEQLPNEFVLKQLESEFDYYRIATENVRNLTSGGTFDEWVIQGEKERLQREVDNILQLRRYTSEVSRQYYFGRSRAYINTGLFTSGSHRNTHIPSPDLDVIDLSSISRSDEKRLVVSAVLTETVGRAMHEWKRVVEGTCEDQRVPLFIVVDEAHNLIPTGPCDGATALLREQFRTIAAEGRKYGLFLVIVSQRPDKLDGLIVSECENRVLMRIGSEAVLRESSRLLGLDDVPPKILDKCLEFTTGRALIAGAWVNSPEFFYSAARRTVEGGLDLLDSSWIPPRNTLSKKGPKKTKVTKRKKSKSS